VENGVRVSCPARHRTHRHCHALLLGPNQSRRDRGGHRLRGRRESVHRHLACQRHRTSHWLTPLTGDGGQSSRQCATGGAQPCDVARSEHRESAAAVGLGGCGDLKRGDQTYPGQGLGVPGDPSDPAAWWPFVVDRHGAP